MSHSRAPARRAGSRSEVMRARTQRGEHSIRAAASSTVTSTVPAAPVPLPLPAAAAGALCCQEASCVSDA